MIRPLLEILSVCAFLCGTCLVAGFAADSDIIKGIGVFFGFIFFGLAMAGGFQLRREFAKQRRYERSKKGLVWPS